MLLHLTQYDSDEDIDDDEVDADDDVADNIGEDDAELQRHAKFSVVIAESSIDDSSREKFERLLSS